MMKKIVSVIICMQFLFASLVIAQSNDLVCIGNEIITQSDDGYDITQSIRWYFEGSAATKTHHISSENGEKYLSLYSDAQKNGGLGGTYYLNTTYYPITGEASLDFDVRMNSGQMSVCVGDGMSRGALTSLAFNISFDAQKGKISVNDTILDGTFEKSVWYGISVDFNVNKSSCSIKIIDENDNILSQIDELAFIEPELFFVSNLTISMTSRSVSSFDIKNINCINHNTQNPSGGYMSIDENDVMHNTFPQSAIKTQALIDNQSDSLRRMEYLDRGTVAIKREDDVYISWRWLGTEDISTCYNIYRDGVRLNKEPIKESTNFVDTGGTMTSEYVVKSVVDGVEIDESKKTGVNLTSAITVPLKKYEQGNYSVSDGSVGDLEEDGEYEIILNRLPYDIINNSSYPIIEAYKLNGEHMWTMNVGPNQLGATVIDVFDFNGDGKSEIVMRIGDAFVDGTGESVGDTDGDGMVNYRDSLYTDGCLEKGPEYIAIFEGETGKLIDKVPMAGTISRDPLLQWGTGTNITHRPWHFSIIPVRIDKGENAFVFARGIYGKTGMQCWKLVDNKLEMVWDFDSNDYFGANGQGNHNLTSGDVDFDGYDEIIYGAMAVDHNGELLYTTDLGHGDAIHMGDFDLSRPGLEVVKTNEYVTAYAQCTMFDARTGEVLWGEFAGRDTTRVLCDDIDPRYEGAETHTNGKAFDSQGNVIDSQGGANFGIYWDGDLNREMYDDITISKYMAYDDKTIPLLVADYCKSINGTKANCVLQADILGDWREELVLPSFDDSSLQIFMTTCPTQYKLYTLMHDPHYRAAIAWQNNEYNQPPHLGFNWGYDAKSIPVPKIFTEHNGIRTESVYTDTNRTFVFEGHGEGTYKSEVNKTIIIDGFAHLESDSSANRGEYSEETAALMEHITAYYDDVVETKGMLDYVMLPTSKVYLPQHTRFMCSEDFTITDINDIPIDKITSDIYYDEASGTISVDDDKSVWIKVKGESFEQILNIKGENYTGENTFLRDTLDEKPLGSGSGFLNSRMNINGWKLKGDSENVSVITYADGSYNPKKRLVKLINNSEAEAVFYLNRSSAESENKLIAEFEMQLYQGEEDYESEFIISSLPDGDTSKKSLSIKQIGKALYVGTNGEYKLLASKLEMSTGRKGIYKIVAIIDFDTKKSDIVLTYYDNAVAQMCGVDFYDRSENSIECIMYATSPGCEGGVDDIWVEEYDLPEIECVKITATYTEQGRLESVKREKVITSDFTPITNGNTKTFCWYTLEGMRMVKE